MAHQDWNPVVFNASRQNNPKNKGPVLPEEVIRMKKIEEGTYVIPKVSVALQQQIRNARSAKGMTQKELAAKINVKSNIINSYESGNIIPDAATLQKISRVLGTPLKLR